MGELNSAFKKNALAQVHITSHHAGGTVAESLGTTTTAAHSWDCTTVRLDPSRFVWE